MIPADPAPAPSLPQGKRRDFLVLFAQAVSAVGIAAAAWPLIDSMNPAADTLAAGAPIDVDLAPLAPGQQIVAKWRGKPVFITHRTPTALSMLQKQDEIALLRDPTSQVRQQPDYADNWYRSIEPEYGILVGICTHLGCIPKYRPVVGGDLGKNWPGGYFCPCHGSRYDLAGRVFKGVPAPYNLPVPPYRFVAKTVVRIGENPAGSRFDFGSIVQV